MASSPIIDLDAWNVEETKISFMKNSTAKNCAVTNSVTKLPIKTPLFKTTFGVDDKYGLKIKINRDEIPFEKFQEFDEFIENMDKSTIFEKKKREPVYCPLICNDSFMNFYINIDKLIVIDEEHKIVELEIDILSKASQIDTLKSLVHDNSKIICFIKFDYLYNLNGKYGVKKFVTKIQLLE